ncbi:MurR/RpiR family transcriptional regulator [Herbaspirillum seropedicae]|uniref:Transcription regulator protein n=1 Tax=Herbaspirillum seropedicae (strain SmR1) TaxID=757424 RepID=D8IPU3_HERSS|nr:MurR/RpiR family transcriptional regulator [Herbaspirillum seropedicae]ADJ64990.1 transcription regulator protein [Herbaspirillum seropedicae SmR1]AKN66870.1 RpiR family transcriptional regulator [Herbaspirillum seropedicae]NQE28116.1 RpiR family transcriptional regulator [Herbaspirillum seropedicae]UMU22866.1 MurR/RpiR family transcriptional regulator [Herbaspirillum seropedicae]
MAAELKNKIKRASTTESRDDSVPRTVEELRSLTVRIGRGKAEFSLGVKAHAVLAKLVERPEEVAVRSITDLAASLGVNASTLTRLATRLGYSGFVDFQNVFRDGLASSHRNFYSQQAQRLITDGPGRHEGDVLAVAQLAAESARNMESCLAQLSAVELRGAVKLLARARHVRIYGVRQMHSLASFLCYGLGMIRSEVSLLDAPGQGIAEGLAQLQRGDVLVVASVSPYTRIVAEVAQAASNAGLNVIALTDNRASPLVSSAKYAFFVPHESSFFSNSIGAYVVFSEGLMNLVARDLGSEALSALERREGFITDLRIECQ